MAVRPRTLVLGGAARQAGENHPMFKQSRREKKQIEQDADTMDIHDGRVERFPNTSERSG